MDWGFIGIVLSIILFIVTVYLTLKLIKKKVPAWAHRTDEIIDLGEDAPKELQLMYEGKSVRGVYRTTVILLNDGAEVINEDDVTIPMTVFLDEGEILGGLTIKSRSNEENRVKLEKQKSCIVTKFNYLGHKDGVVFDFLHTATRGISFKVNIKGINKTKDKGEFQDYSQGVLPKPQIIGAIAGALCITSLLVFIGINPKISTSTLNSLAIILSCTSIIGFFVIISSLISLIKSSKFPSWSRNTISVASVSVTQIYGYCAKCKAHKSIKDPTIVVLKSGRRGIQGFCPECGTKILRLLPFNHN